MSAAVHVKAGRLLAAGRVTITRLSPYVVAATVRGDHGRYRVVGDPARWTCTCPARLLCSHAQAVALVVSSRLHPPAALDSTPAPPAGDSSTEPPARQRRRSRTATSTGPHPGGGSDLHGDPDR